MLHPGVRRVATVRRIASGFDAQQFACVFIAGGPEVVFAVAIVAARVRRATSAPSVELTSWR